MENLFGWPIELGFDIGNVVAVLIALASLLITVGAIRKREASERLRQRAEDAARASQRELQLMIERSASAKKMYYDYLRLAFENPEYSIGRYQDADPVDTEKYDTFVTMMLYAFDELLDVKRSENELRSSMNKPSDKAHAELSVIRYQLELHSRYLVQILHKDTAPDRCFRSDYPRLLPMLDEMFLRLGMTAI
jgi:hypothetical protein